MSGSGGRPSTPASSPSAWFGDLGRQLEAQRRAGEREVETRLSGRPVDAMQIDIRRRLAATERAAGGERQGHRLAEQRGSSAIRSTRKRSSTISTGGWSNAAGFVLPPLLLLA